MYLKDRIFDEASSVLRSPDADAVEVVVNSFKSSTLRFASSNFHQGAAGADCEAYVRVIVGRKVGVASTNDISRASLKDCLKRAVTIAEHVTEEPVAVFLPAGGAEYPYVESYFESTASMSDSEKVSVISQGFRKALKTGVLVSGALTTDVGEVAVVNSSGVEAYHPYTSAHLSAVGSRDGASGFKSAISKDISRIDAKGVIDEAARRCVASLAPREATPGVYRVLFEPPAVAELLHWLAYTGLGAHSFNEGTSYISGHLGEKVTGEKVTVYDDPLDPVGMSMPFDFEGTPKSRRALIEKGVARGVVYDSFTSALEGVKTTGHASFPEDPEGPLPDHVFMAGGRRAATEMLEVLGSGLLVSSFHYVNGLLDTKASLMTGMTRHGTFLVEEGRIKHPVRPLRFTESVLKAFERIVEASREIEVFPNHDFPLSSVAAPYLVIDGFRFTS